MSAQLKEGAAPLDVPMQSTYLVSGRRVLHAQTPECVIDPVDIYGTLTTGYSSGIREKLKPYLNAQSIGIYFEKFTEGRTYSLAQRLRELGYTGEIHAIGNLNREILFLLVRVGFTHAQLFDQGEEIDPSIVFPFSSAYQTVFGE